MQTLDVPLPPERDLRGLPAAVEQAAHALALTAALAGTLKSYPGSRHWHLRRGREPGTLEVTWWPAERRLWLKVASGRAGVWTIEYLPRFRAALLAAAQALPVLVAGQSIER